MSGVMTTAPPNAILRRNRGSEWVSKTDLTGFVRCPYAWWLLDQGQISVNDTVSEFQYRLMIEGSEFQGAIESMAAPLTIVPEELPVVLAGDKKLLAIPVFENHKLHIYGQPDGIYAEAGALIPVEIKSHKDVQRTDELELAFYWLLLEPSRTRKVEPRGILLLRRNGQVEEVEVTIPANRFDEVRRLLGEIRAARRGGVRPRICSCHVCSTVKREEVMAATRQREDLTLIHGIGRVYGPALEAIGIMTWRDLMSWDSRRVLKRLTTKRRFFLSARQVEYWKRHAESFATMVPVAFGEGPALPTSYIALDLEYTPPHIWLMGIGIVNEERRQFRSLWADGPVALRRNLEELAGILGANRTLPLLTWGGNGADLPNLVAAIHRLLPAKKPGQGGWEEPHPLVAHLWDRHLDLYQYVWRGLRLPIPYLGLKEVSEYFAIPRVSNIADGLAAQMFYAQYRHAKGSEKKAMRQQLIAYNHDDLEALIEVTDRVRRLMVVAEPIVLPMAKRQGRVRRLSPGAHDVPPTANRRKAWSSSELRAIASRNALPRISVIPPDTPGRPRQAHP